MLDLLKLLKKYPLRYFMLAAFAAAIFSALPRLSFALVLIALFLAYAVRVEDEIFRTVCYISAILFGVCSIFEAFGFFGYSLFALILYAICLLVSTAFFCVMALNYRTPQYLRLVSLLYVVITAVFSVLFVVYSAFPPYTLPEAIPLPWVYYIKKCITIIVGKEWAEMLQSSGKGVTGSTWLMSLLVSFFSLLHRLTLAAAAGMMFLFQRNLDKENQIDA